MTGTVVQSSGTKLPVKPTTKLMTAVRIQNVDFLRSRTRAIGGSSMAASSPSHCPQLSRVEPGHMAGSRLHLVVHVLGAARTIAAGTVPETDEPCFGNAPRQRRIQEP